MRRITIRKLVSIGSVVSLGGLALSLTINQDFRTTIYERARQAVARTAPDTVRIPVSDPALLPTIKDALGGAVEEMKLEFFGLAEEVDNIEAAIAGIDSSHEELVERVKALAALERPRPVIYVVVDSVFVAVDPDTLQGAEEWLRLLWPWYEQMKGVNHETDD